ncbi:acetyl-CoA carboxylase biotin carboxyl carrier protein [Thermoflexibacter ruber]|uniref:Biotin carboxyl carrier protein of acetyl-CoA carboxylase n=1 Tax=Thermoflexibacter ruber TaxID=1003 RepID=A0A1I2FB55_9BACT|nr:acetyl-CoA carboxylase biotin carboxyl carrier protein [Thermoflexibacter ruber]SFF01770.1 acetyl-CoA carboxylase biotin carboxyl carrier protein [Thermoflexibacter ruber]
MSAKELQDLLNFIANSGLDEVNIEGNDFKIRVKRHSNVQQVITQPVITAPVVPPVQQVAVTPSVPVTTPVETKTEKTADSSAGSSKLVAIKSPMIGTFYRASSPDKPPFVSVGDEITAGKVVCIIEAMKLFNEIESEVSGKIVKVLVENASPVEYDQELFLVEVA